jgi:hypothetical protein
MSVWLPATASEQPDVTLTDWAAFEVLTPEIGEPTVHLVGCFGFVGRVTSPLASVDAEQKAVVTQSGRVYRVAGPSGLRGGAVYVWQQWVRMWDAKVLSDATAALQQLLEPEEKLPDHARTEVGGQ